MTRFILVWPVNVFSGYKLWWDVALNKMWVYPMITPLEFIRHTLIHKYAFTSSNNFLTPTCFPTHDHIYSALFPVYCFMQSAINFTFVLLVFWNTSHRACILCVLFKCQWCLDFIRYTNLSFWKYKIKLLHISLLLLQRLMPRRVWTIGRKNILFC